MGVQAHQHAVAAADVAAEPFDLVGVDVRRGDLNGGRQIEDHLVLRGRLPDVQHGVTDLHGKVQLGGGENFRRVLEGPLGFGLFGGQLLDQFGSVDGDIGHALLVLLEDDAAEARCGRVVNVNDRLLGATHGLEGALDQVGTRLGQHLNGDVIRDVAILDQGAHKVEIGL